MTKRLMTFVLVTALLVSLSSTVFAQEGDNGQKSEPLVGRNIKLEELPEKEREILIERSKVVEQYIWEIEKAHANLRNLENQKSKATTQSVLTDLSNKITAAKNAVVVAQNDTEKYGLVKIDPNKSANEVSTLSSIAGNFNITENYILWDSAANKYIYHTAGNWGSSAAWKDDLTCSTFSCNSGWRALGGTDGYYLASLNEQINTYNANFWTLQYSDWANGFDKSYSSSTYSTAYGFGWEHQDLIKLSCGTFGNCTNVDYDSDRQLGWFYFTFVNGKPTGKTLSFKVDVGHSWSSTSLTGIGIGPWSFSFSWSNEANKWNKAVPTTYTF